MANSDEISTAEPNLPAEDFAGSESRFARNSDADVLVSEPAADETSEAVDRNPVLMLGYSCFFFVLLASQYLWFYFDKPEPLVWDRGEEFQTFRVDVNDATWVDWIQLPGIGQATAEDILEDLERNGPFQSIDDLMRVKGIGPKTLDQIRGWLTISDDETAMKR